MVGAWFMAFFLILTPAGKTVGKLGYKDPVAYEDCQDLLAHRDIYQAEVHALLPKFNLDKGHCDPLNKPSV